MKIGFISLGCSKNRVDSEHVMGLLVSSGHSMVQQEKEADVIFVNTCGFITPAKEEAISTILEMSEIKKQTGAKLVVIGCLSERYYDDLVQLLPEVDRFITLKEYPIMHQILQDELGIRIVGTYGKKPRLLSTQPWLGYLKIAEGCSNRCTYCAIPLIRKDFRSYPLEELIEQAQQLAKSGVKELVLIAQDTTRYGIDLYHQYKLPELVKELAKIESFHWIRILYMYPDEVSVQLIDELASIDKVLPYFDLPLQHGDDVMLAAMNRRGTVAYIEEMIQYIRKVFPSAVLRTTMIVGFPGETNVHFKRLIAFIKRNQFDRLGAFTYSKEEDTPAYDYPNEPKESTKQKRYQELMQVQAAISEEKSASLVGQTFEVLIEAYDSITQTAKGRTIHSAPDNIDGYTYIHPMKEIELGSFVKAKITRVRGHDLIASQIDEERG